MLPAEARSLATHTRNPYLLVLEVELLRNGEADLMSNIMGAVEGPIPSPGLVKARNRRQRVVAGAKAGVKGAVRPVRAGGGAAGFVVGGAYSKGAKIAGGAVGRVREFKEKREQRKEGQRGRTVLAAQENDPFSITETPVERTVRMQQRALSGRASPTYAAVTAQEEWAARRRRVQEASVHSDLPNWSLYAMVVKCDDDVRQEMFCMHLVTQVQQIFAAAGLERLAGGLRPYSIQSTSSRSGIIEAMTDATSVGRSCAAPAPPLRRR